MLPGNCPIVADQNHAQVYAAGFLFAKTFVFYCIGCFCYSRDDSFFLPYSIEYQFNYLYLIRLIFNTPAGKNISIKNLLVYLGAADAEDSFVGIN